MRGHLVLPGHPPAYLPRHTVAARRVEPPTYADRILGYVSSTGDREEPPADARSSTATKAGGGVIDLDPLWRLVIVLTTFGAIPLLLTLGWAIRKARDSYTAVLLRSWWRGHRRSWQRRRHRRTPAGSGRAPDALGPAGHHPRRAS